MATTEERVDELVYALGLLLHACEVFERAFDTDEGWQLYDGAKRHARRVLMLVAE